MSAHLSFRLKGAVNRIVLNQIAKVVQLGHAVKLAPAFMKISVYP